MNKGYNLKPRSNLDKRGRRTEKIQHRTGLEPTAFYGTIRLASTKANEQLSELSSFLKKAIRPSKFTARNEETRKTVLGELPCLFLETTHHKRAELEDHMKIASVTIRIVLFLDEEVTQTLEGSDRRG